MTLDPHPFDDHWVVVDSSSTKIPLFMARWYGEGDSWGASLANARVFAHVEKETMKIIPGGPTAAWVRFREAREYAQGKRVQFSYEKPHEEVKFEIPRDEVRYKARIAGVDKDITADGTMLCKFYYMKSMVCVARSELGFGPGDEVEVTVRKVPKPAT